MNGVFLIARRFVLSFAAILGMSLGTGLSAQEAEALVPLEAFAALPFIDKPQMSPDGDFIAGLMAIQGQQQIAIIPLKRSQDTPLVRLPLPENTEIRWLRWVNNDHFIVGLSAQLKVDRDNLWYVSRLISVDRKSGTPTKLMWELEGQTAKLLWVARDGSPEIIMSGQDSIYRSRAGFWPGIYRVNVATGKSQRIQHSQHQIQDWGVDHNGDVRLGIRYDDASGKTIVRYRPFASGGFQTIERARTRRDENVSLPFAFVDGTDHGLFLDENTDGQTVVKEINLLTDKEIAVRHALPETDIVSVWLSDDEQAILGLRADNDKKSMHWIDPKLAAAQALLDKAVKNASINITSYNRDRTRFLVKISAPNNPGLYYIYDSAAQDFSKLMAVNEKIGNRTLAKVKYVQYQARDGLEIEGVLTLPQGREAKNLPLIMLPHGGPWAHDTVSYDYWSQFLASRGYAVLQPNFRGSTGYGKDFLERGEGQMGLAMQDDVTDGLHYLAGQGIVDPKRVCIVGASYGGYAAMWGIAREPDLYRCAISISGVSNLRREVNDFGGSLYTQTYKYQWEKMSHNFAAISPIYAVERITAPLLLIHGERDVTVDHKQSRDMNRAMKKAGKHVEFLSLPDADHYFSREADRIALLSSIEKFLMQYNPPD